MHQYFVVSVRCRRKESTRSLSHLVSCVILTVTAAAANTNTTATSTTIPLYQRS